MADVLRLSTDVTTETLLSSTLLHNRLPTDQVLSKAELLMQSDGFRQLCAIIADHNAQDSFRLRLLHRHMPIPEGQILLGTVIGNAPNAPGYWVTPSNFPKDLHNIHGHVFAVDTDVDNRGHLLPAEFREGPPESIENVDSGFFKAFIDYLQNNNLETIFGLEAIQGQHKKLVEFSFDVGNLLLEEGRVRMDIIAQEGGPFELQDTVWSVVAKDKIVQHTTGETRCVTFKTGHVRMTNSKVTMSGLDVLRILEDEGVLVI